MLDHCRVQHELRYLEMHISDHPMRLLRAVAERLSCVTSECLSQYVDRTERGAVQFITLEDEHGLVEARLSPEAGKRFHPLLSTPGPYLLQGRVQQRQGATYFSILELLPFHQRRTHRTAKELGPRADAVFERAQDRSF